MADYPKSLQEAETWIRADCDHKRVSCEEIGCHTGIALKYILAGLASEKARADAAEALSRRWYNADGTFEDLDPAEVIERRKVAAVKLARADRLEAAATTLLKVLLGEERAQQEPEQGWRPIETAPKDGTAILIYEPKRFIRDEWDGREYDDRRFAIGYWRVWSPKGGWGNRNCADVNPTHWMPLPEPPTGGAQEGDRG